VRRRPSGFTLLEVMVALAILSGAMLAISQIVSAALRNHTRAAHLEVATLLARGKLASLQDGFDRDGFKDFDETDEGTFEREGHPEVHFKLEVVKPKLELGPDQLLSVLTGATGEEGSGTVDLASLLSQKVGESGGSGSTAQTLFPPAPVLASVLRAQLATIGEELKKGLREVRLTVSWPEGAHTESFAVVTHLLAFKTGTSP